MPLSKIISESVDLSDNFNFTGQLQQNGAGIGGANTPAFNVSLTSNVNISHDTPTLVPYNNKILDTDNCYDNSSQFRFTPTTSGKYFIFASNRFSTGTDIDNIFIVLRKNGSEIKRVYSRHEWYETIALNFIVDMNGSSDYLDVFCYHALGSTVAVAGDSVATTNFGGYKLIGV
jgi:hypothetical protein